MTAIKQQIGGNVHVFIGIIMAWSFSAYGLEDWWEPISGPPIFENTTEEEDLQNITIHHTRPCFGHLALADIIEDFGTGERFRKIEWYVEDSMYLVLTNVQIKNNTIKRATVQYGSLVLYGRTYQAGEKILPHDKIYDKENSF